MSIQSEAGESVGLDIAIRLVKEYKLAMLGYLYTLKNKKSRVIRHKDVQEIMGMTDKLIKELVKQRDE